MMMQNSNFSRIFHVLCKILLILFIFFALFVELADETLTKSDRKKREPVQKPAPSAKISAKNTSEKISDASTVVTLTYDDVLKNHDHIDYGDSKKFPNPTLAYVTPWNNHGYEIAKILAHKFTHISPVWFQINRYKDACTIGGTHDLDHGWITDIRKNNSQIKIVPRFLFDKWTVLDLQSFLLQEDEQNRCARVVIEYIQRNQFEGAVIEIWTKVLTTFQQYEIKPKLIDLLINFAEHFKMANLEIALVVPPLQPGTEVQIFSSDDLEPLVPFFDYFSVMTYDYPTNKPYAVAPAHWIHECMTNLILDSREVNRKLMMGLNFYGYDYSSRSVEPATGNKYVQLLRTYKPKLYWDKYGAEHFMQYDSHTLYYPSLHSIELRLNMARKLGVGVAIWEIGQGLDYFYNLF